MLLEKFGRGSRDMFEICWKNPGEILEIYWRCVAEMLLEKCGRRSRDVFKNLLEKSWRNAGDVLQVSGVVLAK